MSEPYENEMIEDYLLGHLSGEELKAFEKRMQEEPELLKQVELEKDLKAVIQLEGRIELQEKLEAIYQEGPPASQAKPAFRWYYWAAASVAVLLVLGYFVSRIATPPANNMELFAANFEVYPDKISEKGWPSQVEESITAYQDKNYPAALQSFQSLPDSIKNDPLILIYIGNTLLSLHPPDTKAAVETLSIAEKANDPEFGAAVRWYLCLALLADDKVEEAKANLEKLEKENLPVYSDKAKALLKQMEPL